MDIEQHRVVPHSFKKPDPPKLESPATNVVATKQPARKVGIEKAKQKNRCFQCNKKLGLMPFDCRCGAVTCIRCKWPDHDCTFDYRAQAAEQIASENPVVVADKITRI